MLVKNQENSFMSEMDDLFGPPPLMKGEDKARYDRLLAAIWHEFKPQTVFEKIRVREFADKLWQQQRCKQSVASLVEGGYIEALASLLGPFNPPPLMSIGEDATSEMARNYYSGEAKTKEMEAMDSHLAKCGITAEQIRAKAMQLCGGGIAMFNRMEAHCEASLRMLQKENDRRPAVENTKAFSSDQPDDEEIK